MKTIKYEVSDAIAVELTNALAARNSYSATIPDPANPTQTIANPESKQDFALRMGWELFKAELMAYRRRQGELSASTSAVNATPSII